MASKPYRSYWERRRRRKHAVVTSEEAALSRIDRTQSDREYIQAEIRRRQQPEVDQWEQDFYGRGDKPGS